MSFVINLVANLLFRPFSSGMRSVHPEAVDILVGWATIVWMIVAVWPHYSWVAAARAPYFVGVSIATVLQVDIT
jgi:tryptophan-rich sensory protein